MHPRTPLHQTVSADQTATTPSTPPGSVLEVLLAFLKLGLTSFGGPIAHLGYFRTEFVERRRWLDDRRYGDLVALCQFLPGPASSQVGMALGLERAGWSGALAAWFGFTLPSAIALVLFAFGVAHWPGVGSSGVVHGLKVGAVAVVAQAVWGMARSLCPDRLRAGIAISAALIVLALPSAPGQIGAIVLGGLVGYRALKLHHVAPAASPHRPGADLQGTSFEDTSAAEGPCQGAGHHRVGQRTGAVLLVLFIVLLVLLPALARTTASPWLDVAAKFYAAGALVFGGGHVVLPLLQAAVVPPGLVTDADFLAGYGAAQAVPGPLFTFAAYLGAVMREPVGGWLGALAMLVAIFVPAFLLVAGALPFWEALRRREPVQRALGGINAAVVGLLGAALYDPVWTSAIHTRADFALALASFGLLVHARTSPVLVVALAAAAGWIIDAMA